MEENMEENQVLGVIDSGVLSYKLSDVQNMLNESLLGDFGSIDVDQGLETNMTAPHYEPYEKRLSTYIMPTIFALIFLIGVLGNGCLILIFFRHRSMRNIPNTYILSLAVADLLVIVTTVPFTTTIFIYPSWLWGDLICRTSEFFKDLSIGVSVFTLTALSGDRFFAIVNPLRKLHSYHGKRARRITIAIITSIWTLATLMGIPAIKASHVITKTHMERGVNITFKICYPFPEEWGKSYAQTIVMGRFLFHYAIPLAIISVFYVLIAKHLMHSANHVPGELQGTERQVKTRRKVAVTVLSFVVLFGICFFPIHLFMLWFYYNPNSENDYNAFWHVLRMVGFTLSFANSCTNPLALYCISGVFRKHFNRYLFCCQKTSSTSIHHTFDKSTHQELSQSTILRRYPSKRFSTNTKIRSPGGAAESTMVMLVDREDRVLIENDKTSII